MRNNPDWDLIVIGGGPAGMMAAGRAAELGRKVLLLEKNSRPGEKLLITGGGRCNVTNAEPDTRKLLSKFKDANKFLFSPFSQLNNIDAISFFNTRGVETKIENEQRVFPVSNSATTIWNTLIEYLRLTEVVLENKSEVKEIQFAGNSITGIVLKNEKVLIAKKYILATGGKSRPETGSTGDGFLWLRSLGHNVIEPIPSLVPVKIKDEWVKKIPGVVLSNIKLTVFQNNQKQEVVKGKILFTHFGITGPTVLNISKDIAELLKYDQVEVSLDLLPDEDYSVLNTRLQELFKSEDKKQIKNALTSIIPSAIIPVALEKSQVVPETPCHSITREERLLLVKVIKDIRMEVSGLLGEEKAIVTSGGIDLSEVDFKTMQSTIFPNLYLVGDILNIDRPSGGYSLQLCWTTGFVAGTHSAGI